MSSDLSKERREQLQSLRDQPDRLIELILQQANLIEELQKKNEELQEQIRDINDKNNRLEKRVEEAEKKAARQAAPFRLPEKKRQANPKQPGRKPGHRGCFRPKPQDVDEHIYVPLPCCPKCGEAVNHVKPVEQYIEEIPPVRPRVIKLVTHEGCCGQCGKVRSSHPLQTSLARGAAGVQLGPRALAVAVALNKHQGLPMRRTCKILKELFGLSLSAGGLAQAVQRVARKLSPSYDELLARMRDAPVVHSDETSWWVGRPHWLWVFTHPQSTLYRVTPGRGRDVITKTLGEKFAGVLVSDCLSIYDDVNERQQKCYAHHLKAIREAMEARPDSTYLREVRAMLHAALALKGASLEASVLQQHQHNLEQTADRLLSIPRPDGMEERVRKRLFKQRDHLFTFLEQPAVDATNNLAERQLRPAVIARKLSCGNKTDAGARAWEILTSLAVTCQQQATSFLDLVAQKMPVVQTR